MKRIRSSLEKRESTVKTSSAKLVTAYAVTAIRWLQIDAVWNYGVISSVNMWLNHGTNFPVMLSQHLQPTHSRIVSTCCRVGHYKAEASTPDTLQAQVQVHHVKIHQNRFGLNFLIYPTGGVYNILSNQTQLIFLWKAAACRREKRRKR